MKPSDRDRDLQREIALHLELEAEERRAAGLSAADAQRAAHRAFGNVTATRERARDVWIAAWFRDAVQDVRYAVRVFARMPAFAAAAVLILALGIGASTAIFGAIRAVILAPLPYASPDRLAQLWLTNPSRGIDRFSVSLPLYRDWQTQTRSWAELAAFKRGSVTIAVADTPEQGTAQVITANAIPLLGLPMRLGRGFLPEEDVVNGPRVAIVSEAFWRRALGADPTVVGRTIAIDGIAHTVVGVAAGMLPHGPEDDLLLPLAGRTQDRRSFSELDVIGRLRPGVSLEGAASELVTLTQRIARENPDGAEGWSAGLQPLDQVLVAGQVRQRMYLLFAAVGALLLIACANLSGLLLVRASTRSREMAVRAAIGGGRGRIVRQLLAESLLLAAGGGAAGLALAVLLMHLLRTQVMTDVPRASTMGLDVMVLLFAGGITAVAGTLAGLAPARQAARLDIQRGLRERSPAAGGARHARHALVVGQLALSIVLLAASGLMLRTLDHLGGVDLGFVPDRILTLQVAPRTNPEAFFATLIDRVRQLPDVVAAGATSGAPMTSGNTSLHVFPVGPARIAPTDSVQADFRAVTAGYFAAMQTPLRAGRDFTPHDDENATKVVVVSESLARALWGNEDPIGRRIDLGGGGGEPATVIGLVGDVRIHAPGEAARPTYYVSAYRSVWGPMTVAVRSASTASTLLPLVRAEVRALDPSLPVFGIHTMDSLVSARLAPERVLAGLLGGFAVLSLVLAVAGIHGAIAYSTAQRTHEIGIRLALGATRRLVLGMLLREGVVLVAVGAVLGLVVAVPVTRLMRDLLAGVAPGDPVTFATALAVLAGAALAACYLPARRVAGIDPVRTLRGE